MFEGQPSKGVCCLVAGFAAGVGVGAWLASRLLRSKANLGGGGECAISDRDNDDDRSEAIFFPDDLTAAVGKNQSSLARGNILYREILYDKSLREGASLARVLRHLSAAQSSIDLCLFVINSHQLADAVLDHLSEKKKSKRRFRVRLIVDESSFASAGSAVPKFRSAGAFVRFKKMDYLMHHKFVVVDGRLVMTGSFNWTMQAILGNKENVVVSTNPKLVQPFAAEFEKLWEEFGQ